MTHVLSRAAVVAALLTAALAGPAASAQHSGSPLPPPDQPVRLFDSSSVDGALTLRLSAAAIERVRAAGAQRIVTEPFAIAPGLEASLSLQRFEVVAPGARFVVGSVDGEHALDFDPARVILFRGEMIGRAGSHVYLAISELGVTGILEPGPGQGGARYVLAGLGERHGLARGPLRVVEASGFGAPPLVNVCEMRRHDDQPPPPHAPPEGVTPSPGMRHVQIAIETDYEYFQLFGNLNAAAAYAVALYGAVSDIYQRDVNARVQVVYLRLWDTPQDLFNDPDPLSPFANYWNANMGAVARDVAQLLTGRRNLPYGGVAYLNGLCNNSSYSVTGWILGSFADSVLPNAGNWDVVVTAHELGHNCGTLHTQDYGLDSCNTGQTRRGCIMSYCHITSGGNANIDLNFHTLIQGVMKSYMNSQPCIAVDCNGNNQPDSLDIALGVSLDRNNNGVPDECEDCNGNGTLDPQDIASGASLDRNGNGVPDECEPDCNNNNVPDDRDILLGASIDANGNGVPDECETDCNRNGQSDYAEIQTNMSLDVDRNAALDACQDCDHNGVSDLLQLSGALNIWMAGLTQPSVREFHGGSGAPVKSSASAALTQCQDLVISPSGKVLVSSGNRVAAFNPASGAALGDFVAAGSGGLSSAAGMIFGPDGNLYISSRGNDAVLRFDGATGAFIGVFVAPGAGGLIDPYGLAFGPNGNLFITTADHRVLEFNGSTGAFVRILVTTASGGLNQPHGLLFKPDGKLLVASYGSNAVLEYNGSTGAFIRRFDSGGPTTGMWGLQRPWALRLSRRGDVVFVTSNLGSTALHSYNVVSGWFRRSYYILAMDMAGPTGFDVVPPAAGDCNMNLVPDACDIASGHSHDLNGNGVPDECEPHVPGDITGDGHVNVDDLLAVITSWGRCPAPPAPCPADIAPPPSGDGAVNVNDLLFVITHWG